MPDTNHGKFDIDELVNSLLLERQSCLADEVVEPDSPAEMEAVADLLLNPVDEDAADLEDDAVEERPSLLIPNECFGDAAEGEKEQIDETISETVQSQPLVVEEKTVPLKKDQIQNENHSIQTAPSVVTPVATAVAVAEVIPEAVSQKKKKRFGRKVEDTATIERTWADWGLKPIGHYRMNESVKAPEIEDLPMPIEKEEEPQPVIAPETPSLSHTSSPVDEFPAVAAVAETITMQVVLPSGVALPRGEAHTRIIPVEHEENKPVAQPVVAVESKVEEQLPDQLSLEEMVRVEDIEPADGVVVVADDVDPEERLQLAREEKVREFTLDGDEEEANEPEEEPADVTDNEEIEDYTGYQDTETVAAELKYRCRASLFSLLATGLIQIFLLGLTFLTIKLDTPPMANNAYLLTHLFALCAMMVLNISTITHGLSGLFSLRANNDTAPALAASVGLIDVIVHLMNPAAPLPYWTPLVGLLLVLSAVAHHIHERSVRRNFAFVSYPGDKYSAAIIENESALQEIGRRAVSDGEATVAYFRRTGFLTDYLANAYDDDCGDDWSRWATPVAFGLSIVLSLLSLLSEYVTGALDWMSVFTGMVCLSMPVTMLAVQLPLARCSRQMLSNGGFLSGWKAVRCFGRPDALAVDIADLYPDESMRLHGIKTFTGTHIDEAILTAASLAVRSGGPLAMIFRRIIENKEELLYEVDSLVYEQGMGLSGWVEGRRVFVGNSKLLQNHGVDVPSADFEARYAKDGRRLVYISIAGQLSAMFVVSYLPDPEIQAALQELCRSRVTLLVRSCDPNITTSDLCESFELDEYYVDVLPASAGRMYVQLTEQPVDKLPALMASNGHILGTARVMSACYNLKVKARIALIVQTVIALLGLVLCLVWKMDDNSHVSLFQPLLVMLSSWFFAWLIPLFRRT